MAVPLWVPAVITAGASLIGGERRNRLQKQLSNTAHQREVADLRAAGLNPILSAFGSGASVPGLSDPVGTAATSAMSTWRNATEIEQIQESTKLTHEQARIAAEQLQIASTGVHTAIEGMRQERMKTDMMRTLRDLDQKIYKGAGGELLRRMQLMNDAGSIIGTGSALATKAGAAVMKKFGTRKIRKALEGAK